MEELQKIRGYCQFCKQSMSVDIKKIPLCADMEGKEIHYVYDIKGRLCKHLVKRFFNLKEVN